MSPWRFAMCAAKIKNEQPLKRNELLKLLRLKIYTTIKEIYPYGSIDDYSHMLLISSRFPSHWIFPSNSSIFFLFNNRTYSFKAELTISFLVFKWDNFWHSLISSSSK